MDEVNSGYDCLAHYTLLSEHVEHIVEMTDEAKLTRNVLDLITTAEDILVVYVLLQGRIMQLIQRDGTVMTIVS